MTIQSTSGTFTATGASDPIIIGRGHSLVNISLNFGTGTVALQRSFDDGTTWLTVKEYTADAEEQFEDYEAGNQYRLNCSAYTSDIDYRLSF